MFVYIAGPLFSEGERWFNLKVKAQLSELGYESFLPQKDGILVEELINDGHDADKVFQHVYELDLKMMNRADIMLAILDGAVIDEGTSFEIGYMTAQQKICYGIQTDSRRQLPSGNNPMLEKSLNTIVTSLRDLNVIFPKLTVEF